MQKRRITSQFLAGHEGIFNRVLHLRRGLSRRPVGPGGLHEILGHVADGHAGQEKGHPHEEAQAAMKTPSHTGVSRRPAES